VKPLVAAIRALIKVEINVAIEIDRTIAPKTETKKSPVETGLIRHTINSGARTLG
jgi:hypothetical protein